MYIFVQAYPSSENQYAMSYVHARNKIYLKENLNFKVVCFSTQQSYVFEGVEVITEEDFINQVKYEEFLEILSHAPNLKNHLRLIKKYKNKISKLTVIFHGHEVLNTKKYYPEEYSYISRKKIYIQRLYDKYKLFKMKQFLLEWQKKEYFSIIYVSEWMKEATYKSLNINLNCRQFVINNNINEEFLENSYKISEFPKADFITIRPLDGAKYGVDLVCNLAKANPNLEFHIYGKGKYFEHNECPINVKHFPIFLEPKNIPEVLNDYKFALMPTRLDAQGVMMCEMASYGIPLLTTNIDVCCEMLGDFKNCYLLDYNDFEVKLLNLERIEPLKSKNYKFSVQNTVEKEIKVLKGELK